MRRYIQISIAGLLVLWALCGSLRAQVPILKASGACQNSDIIRWSTSENNFICQAPLLSGAGTPGQIPISDGTVYNPGDAPSGGIPAGLITITLTTCPSGWSEATALDGITLVGTLAAHADVGTTGGSDTLTPSGTVSQPTFAGNALGTHAHGVGTFAASAPTFTGSALGTHSHTSSSLVAAAQTFTGSSTTVPALAFGTLGFSGNSSTVVVNHVHVQTINSSLTGSTGSGFPALLDATTSGGPTSLWMSTANPTGGAASYTPAGSITGSTATGALTPLGGNATSAVTGSTTSDSGGTPAGTNSAPSLSGSSEAVGAGTPSGTVSQPTFSGAGADNRSAFVRVIFCSKD